MVISAGVAFVSAAVSRGRGSFRANAIPLRSRGFGRAERRARRPILQKGK
jgi:hypothetical protein